MKKDLNQKELEKMSIESEMLGSISARVRLEHLKPPFQNPNTVTVSFCPTCKGLYEENQKALDIYLEILGEEELKENHLIVANCNRCQDPNEKFTLWVVILDH